MAEVISHDSKINKLTPEEQEQYERDEADLQAEDPRLVSRLKFGIDPAAMMVLRDIKPISARIAEMCGTTLDKVWPLIRELHDEGPWNKSDQLKTGLASEIQTYIVLAEACHETEDQKVGMTPREYLEDRIRVIQHLLSFTPTQVQGRKHALMDRIQDKRSFITIEVHGKNITVPCGEGDPALAFAMEGYKGCVTKGGPMYFAQTSYIPDEVLDSMGLMPGFGEVFDPKTGEQQRFSLTESPEHARIVWVRKGDTVHLVPIAKRISEGYILTYEDKELAAKLVALSWQKGNKTTTRD